MNKEKFYQALDMLDIKYDDDTYEKFEIYTDFLLSYNEKVNLTAITDRDEVYTKHFIDSLSVLNAFDIKDGAKVIDVGTGAGFPSVPVEIIRKDINLTLMDSLNKRIKFLDELTEKLGLENAVTIHARAEELARNPEHRQKYDICLSRAVANMSTLLEYTSPFIKKGGYMLFLKGQNVDEEIENAKGALKKLKCIITKKIPTNIPFTDLNHNIIVVKKTDDTPKAYPRKAGMPSKNPL